MSKPFFYQTDTGPKWTYRVVGFSLLITLGIFMILPISEMLYQQKKRFKLRDVNTLEILKALPRIPPKVKRKTTTPKPKLSETRKRLSPLYIKAALQVDPGFGDFGLTFDLRSGVGAESLVFEVSEVDDPPKPITQIMPLYPMKARMKGIEGKVIFEVVVQADGTISNIVVRASEPGDLFVASAMNAIKKWRFKPGTRNGKPVATRVIIPLRFSLTD